MRTVSSKPLRGTVAPESTVTTMTPEGVPLATVGKLPAAAAMPEAALIVVTLLMNVARQTVEIAIEMPPLACAQVPIGPEGPLLTADTTRFTPEAGCLAARKVAVPYSSLDAVVLHVLALIDATLALSRRDRQCDGARKQCRQECTRCHALHVFLHFRLMPVAVRRSSAFASGGAPMDQGVDSC